MPDSPQQPVPTEDPSSAEPDSFGETEQHLVIGTGTRSHGGERYALEHLFLEWAWPAGFPDGWDGALRALARTLRGLERAGLIQRRTIRRPGHPTHHGFTLTELGREAIRALSGNWIERAGR